MLNFLIKNKNSDNIFDDYDLLLSKFPNVDDSLSILESKKLLNILYADDQPYIINITPQGLNYPFEQKAESKANLKNNLLFPFIISLVSLIIGYLLGKFI